MKKFGVLYSNLRIYYSRDFPTYNPDEIENLNNKIAYYFFPAPNSTFNFTPEIFGQDIFNLNLI